MRLRCFFQDKTLFPLSGVLLVRFLPTWAENEHTDKHQFTNHKKQKSPSPALSERDFIGAPPSRVLEEMEPCYPGRRSMPNFTAPNVSLSDGTSQPNGQEEVCKPLFNLFRAPLINCRSQSSEYHKLSRKNSNSLPRGKLGNTDDHLSLNYVNCKLNFSLAFTDSKNMLIT